MDLTGAKWRKSSFSGNESADGGCVEVAFLDHNTVALRDSKDRTRTPHVFTTDEWHHFIAAVHAAGFTRP